jgi:catechol 2,3-dioxygenase-like lactoylglutathione lyase family enzyme
LVRVSVLRELVVGDDPEVWAKLGFSVDGDRCRVGHVDVVFDPSVGKGIRRWTLVGEGPGDIDGVPTTWAAAPVEPGGPHPNGVFEIDHVVLTTPDVARTVDAFEGLGIEARRQRETGTYGAPMLQTFFKLGQPILELIGPKEPAGEQPARFFGLAFTSEDLDASAAYLGATLHRSKEAVQPGRRIATVDKAAGSTIAIAIMSAHTKEEDVV